MCLYKLEPALRVQTIICLWFLPHKGKFLWAQDVTSGHVTCPSFQTCLSEYNASFTSSDISLYVHSGIFFLHMHFIKSASRETQSFEIRFLYVCSLKLHFKHSLWPFLVQPHLSTCEMHSTHIPVTRLLSLLQICLTVQESVYSLRPQQHKQTWEDSFCYEGEGNVAAESEGGRVWHFHLTLLSFLHDAISKAWYQTTTHHSYL